MLRLAPLAALAILAVAAPPAFAQQGDTLPETVLRSAERALQDDSLETVTTRWRAALERDSTDPAATLGLATVARQTYDFERADSLLNGLSRPSRRARPRWRSRDERSSRSRTTSVSTTFGGRHPCGRAPRSMRTGRRTCGR